MLVIFKSNKNSRVPYLLVKKIKRNYFNVINNTTIVFEINIFNLFGKVLRSYK